MHTNGLVVHRIQCVCSSSMFKKKYIFSLSLSHFERYLGPIFVHGTKEQQCLGVGINTIM